MTVIQKYLIKYLAKIHGTVWFYNVISAWLGKCSLYLFYRGYHWEALSHFWLNYYIPDLLIFYSYYRKQQKQR